MACKNCGSKQVVFDTKYDTDRKGRDVEVNITYCLDCGLELNRKVVVMKYPRAPKEDREDRSW